MAHSYLILTSTSSAFAWAISAKIWKLVNPDADSARFTTKYWSGIVTHPDGRLALTIPENDDVAIHPLADTNDLPDSLGALVSTAGKGKLKADMELAKGKTVKARDLIPFEKLGSVKTKMQMDYEGWFPSITP